MREGNKYDKIVKENLSAYIPYFVRKKLKLTIIKEELLDTKLQTTLEREPDFLRIVETDDGKRFILHIEVQSQNDPSMIYRIAEYHGILLRKFKLEIRHIVLYLGNSTPNMVTSLPDQHQFSGFELFNIKDFPIDEMIESDISEVVLMGLLGKYDKENTNNYIWKILQKLKALNPKITKLSKYIKQLQIFSKLRNLEQETHQTIRIMPIQIDWEDLLVVKEAKKEARIKGMEEGKEEGIKEGKEIGLELGITIVNLYKQNYSLPEISKKLDISAELVKKVIELYRKSK